MEEIPSKKFPISVIDFEVVETNNHSTLTETTRKVHLKKHRDRKLTVSATPRFVVCTVEGSCETVTDSRPCTEIRLLFRAGKDLGP